MGCPAGAAAPGLQTASPCTGGGPDRWWGLGMDGMWPVRCLDAPGTGCWADISAGTHSMDVLEAISPPAPCQETEAYPVKSQEPLHTH